MTSLNNDISEYMTQLGKGQIQKAYKGIMTFMAELKTTLDRRNPDYAASAVYFGYMDMTYFAVTPPDLKNKKLKIAIVYLHEQNRFEVWLAGNNRQIQARVIERLSNIELGGYTLSQVGPGVDSIIESILVEQPDFDKPDELKKFIETKTSEFIADMVVLLSERAI